eukprot:6134568-Prorocentrum_lima.AAC.1
MAGKVQRFQRPIPLQRRRLAPGVVSKWSTVRKGPEAFTFSAWGSNLHSASPCRRPSRPACAP